MPGVDPRYRGVDEYFAAARALYASLGYQDQGDIYLGGWSDFTAPASTSSIRSRPGSSGSDHGAGVRLLTVPGLPRLRGFGGFAAATSSA